MRRHLRVLAAAALLPLFVLGWGLIPEPAVVNGDEPPPPWTTAVTPKPLSDHVKKGLAWLAEHQLTGRRLEPG